MLRICKLLACFAIGGVGFFAADAVASQFALSGVGKTAFSAIGAIPCLIALWFLDGNARERWRSLVRPVPRKVWVWRVAGSAISLFGIFLAIGNRSGQFSTFPFAGALVIFIGALVIAFKGIGLTESSTRPPLAARDDWR